MKNINLDVNQVIDKDGNTALHWTAMSDHGVEYAKILIEHDANLDALNKKGYSPERLAEILGKERLSQLLKEKKLSKEKSKPSTHHGSIYSAKSFSIIVIGAGISGITAAHELAERGFNVIILEARSRIGGRINTTLFEGTPIELGCHFIHGPGGNPITPLLKKFHVNFKPISITNTIIYNPNGKPIDFKSLSEIPASLSSKIEGLSKQRLSEASEYEDSSLGILEIDRLREQIKKTSIYMPDAKQSLLSYKLGLTLDHLGGNHLIVNGYSKFSESFLREATDNGLVETLLDHVVTEIKDESHRVVVTTKDHGTIEANAVVCTVPLKVLETIKFNPPLSSKKQESIQKLGMAIHEKIILHFDEPFWPNEAHYLLPYDPKTGSWREIINLHHFLKEKQGGTLLISSHAEKSELEESDNKLIENALNMLIRIFGNKVSEPKWSKVTRWYKDPYAYGSYSYHTEKSSLEDNNELAEPQGKICFAGEHTSYFPSSVDGAYLSGIRAAKDVSKLLNIF